MGMCKGCSKVFNTLEMKDGYCKNCYEDISNENHIKVCNNCAVINKDTSNYCKKCGNKLSNINSNTKDTSKIIKPEIESQEIQTDIKESNVEELAKWAELLKKGFIDKDDFEKKKRELL